MPRTPRFLIEDQPTVYHVISRTCLDGFPMGDVEKEYLLSLIQRFAAIYFSEIIGFCLMGNHFHLLVRMLPEGDVSDEQVLKKYQQVFDTELVPGQRRLAAFRRKWCSLSELMREIKQTFSRRFNRMHGRKGYFWGDRFKSVIVQDGRTLVNCLAYIDLNPIRAGIARRPEDYRWSSLGYHVQSGNEGGLLSLDFGLVDWDVADAAERLRLYREFVYRTGALDRGQGAISRRVLERAESKNFEYSQADRLVMRTRWFTDGAIIGSKSFVREAGRRLGLPGADKRRPREIQGLEECFALRGLRELL